MLDSTYTRFKFPHSLQRWLSLIVLGALLLVRGTDAFSEKLTSSRLMSRRCGGVFRREDIISGLDAKIRVKFDIAKTDVTLVIYNWEDTGALGYTPEGEVNVQYLCDSTAVQDGACGEEDIGRFIVRSNATLTAPVVTARLAFASDPTVRVPLTVSYDVNVTGYYCVYVMSTTDDFDEAGEHFQALAWFKNPYGEIPGVEYHKLPFYGIMSVLYLAVGMVWMGLSLWHWREILPIQNFLSLVTFFIMLENSFTYGFYDYYNNHGSPSNFLLVLVVVLSAGRNTVSLFILLIVSLGFGVVKPTLGSTMQRCIGLAWVHFVFGNLYIAGQMVSREVNFFNFLVFVLPIALAMTVFYIWTFSALAQTIQTLELRRQVHKLSMYRSLYRLLIVGMVGLGVYLACMSIAFRGHTEEAWMARNWRIRWLWTEGFLNVLYALIFWSVLFLWRPTANNSRYGLLLPTSAEDALDDDDYEAGDVGVGMTTAQKRDVGAKGRGATEEDGEEDVLAWAEKNLGGAPSNGGHDNGESVDDDAAVLDGDVEAQLIRDEQVKLR